MKGPTLASFAIEALLLEIIQVRLRVPISSMTQALVQLESKLKNLSHKPEPVVVIQTQAPKTPEAQIRVREENIMQFSAVELEGQLIKPKGN